ncbi:GNAT family N-acetyltransferase [Sporomusa aerivorans]|uniref:bifunctional helix-turn-helix transcriptional regulator/GNAT family N-acetyltransferase n=1 Tax=Sporomusa aerivorans TaxID=204936 RepID=UPI00352AA69F
MDTAQTALLHAIRKFNRFYTNILGLLDQHLLDSEFSLSEARVLYELEHMDDCTSKKLIEKISIDSGYLSRIIKRFEKQGLAYRTQSAEDGRLYYLHLTVKGQATLAALEEQSNQQVKKMLLELQEDRQEKLVLGMELIENALAENPVSAKEMITIRSELKPGDIGCLIQLHGSIYAAECGYNHVFEGYVCKTFYEFLANYSQDKDRLWFAEANGKMIGAIAIVGHTATRAQLRWFILHPGFRGLGLGNQLLSEVLRYSREKGYCHLFLETTDDQQTAIHMYQKVGFIKTKERKNHTWGVEHVEQTYALTLT